MLWRIFGVRETYIANCMTLAPLGPQEKDNMVKIPFFFFTSNRNTQFMVMKMRWGSPLPSKTIYFMSPGIGVLTLWLVKNVYIVLKHNMFETLLLYFYWYWTKNDHKVLCQNCIFWYVSQNKSFDLRAGPNWSYNFYACICVKFFLLLLILNINLCHHRVSKKLINL